jgi:hypothetical protein
MMRLFNLVVLRGALYLLLSIPKSINGDTMLECNTPVSKNDSAAGLTA